MPVALNETHDPSATTWVDSANAGETPFPIQNLPFGVFRPRGDSAKPRVCVAIGNSLLDISACRASGVLEDAPEAAAACAEGSLNRLMALGAAEVSRLRLALFRLLRSGSPMESRVPAHALLPIAHADLQVPARIGDYSDFFASIYHATNAGSMFRPDMPLLPNYKYVPIAYHGRASSIVVSGTPVRRPNGQSRGAEASAPTLGPSKRLDYELELGAFIGAGNPLGQPIPLAQAEQHVFGICLVNDWSARDIQAWEYQPLGPFLGKSFATTVSPWVVSLEALAPFRGPPPARAAGDPEPLSYLRSDEDAMSGAIDISAQLAITSQKMKNQRVAPHVLARTSSKHLYWTIFQMLAHHTVNGCNLRPGDLFATGTVSGPTRDELGSLLELTMNGTQPFSLPGGETRTFLEDGDEVILSAHCRREGFRSIGFGEARGVVVPALPS